MKICIIGGSTAGWWTAGAIEKLLPDTKIVLYDSPDIPHLGVGESTLPQIKTWFDSLGLQEHEWVDECNAVKKYGNYKQGWDNPIGDPFILRFWYNRGHFKEMMADNTMWSYKPGFDRRPNKQKFWDKIETDYDYAYHVCAEASGVMMRKTCERTEVREETLTELPSGFDLYLDCTGFSRKFVKDFTEMPISKNHTLDSAWVCPMQREDFPITEYTKSIARRYGWQFQVDLQNRTGLGYVFSNRHIDTQSALLEYQTFWKEDMVTGQEWLHENQKPHHQIRKPIEGVEPKLIQWKPMVLENPWSDNVVALGSAAGFVDPLEATALFNLQAGIETLIKAIQRGTKPKAYNRQMRNIWRDSLRFQECHYINSEREDTGFWRSITKERPEYSKKAWDYYNKYTSEFSNIFPSGIWAQQNLYQNTHKEYYETAN